MKVLLTFLFLLFLGNTPRQEVKEREPLKDLVIETEQLKNSFLELKERMKP